MLHYEIHPFSFLSVMVKFRNCVLRCCCIMCMMSDNIIIADAKCVRCVLCVVYTVWLGDIIIHALCTRYCVNQPIPILTFISDWVLTRSSAPHHSCIRLCNIGGRAGVGLASVMCHFSVLNVSGRWHVVNFLYIGAAGEGEVLGACMVSHNIINVKIVFLGQPIL